jgi:5-dehydro-2-deoxygluconokinase
MQTTAYDVISLGRLAIDLYADEVGVPLSKVKHFSVYAGGCPANVAVGTRRLGLRTAIVSRIGVDGLSDGLIDFLEAEGIDTQFIIRDSDHLTGLAFLSILPPETFPLVYYRPDPADLHLSIDDISRIPFDRTRVLFTAGTRFSAEPARSTTIAAMERARAAGTQVILVLDKRPTLWKDLRTYGLNVRAALPLVDIAIGTEDEITAAADQSTVETAVPILLDRVRKAVAVKRGRAGSEIYTKDGNCHFAPPFRVNVLNVLGAGDAWASGFVYAYLQGWDWAKCARLGKAVGAIIVTRHACANDMPFYDDVMAFIDQQGGY